MRRLVPRLLSLLSSVLVGPLGRRPPRARTSAPTAVRRDEQLAQTGVRPTAAAHQTTGSASKKQGGGGDRQEGGKGGRTFDIDPSVVLPSLLLAVSLWTSSLSRTSSACARDETDSAHKTTITGPNRPPQPCTGHSFTLILQSFFVPFIFSFLRRVSSAVSVADRLKAAPTLRRLRFCCSSADPTCTTNERSCRGATDTRRHSHGTATRTDERKE